MHEMSLMASLFRILQENASSRNARRILSVTIRVGALSGVEPDLLSTAFQVFAADSIAEGAHFHITVMPFVVHCQKCGEREISLADYQYKCPQCGGSDIDTPSNDDLLVERMEIEIDDDKSG